MQRRDFIKLAGASAALFPIAPSVFGKQANLSKWNSYRLTYQVNLPTKGKRALLWLPLPDTNDTPHQFSQGSVWSGNAKTAKFQTIAKTAFPVFHAEWHDGGPRRVTVSSVVKTRNRFVDLRNYSDRDKTIIPADIKRFLQPTKHVPLNGIVRMTALSVTKDASAHTPLEKARAIYNWVVDNAYRDQATRGSGRGDIKSMLEKNNLGGKSADLNTLFVGLARAAGVPARNQYGIRIDESVTHKCLGKFGDLSTAQHCRAEFYLTDLGWVPVDPADVHQLLLDERLTHNHPKVVSLREKLFGTWEMNWVTFNHCDDITLGNGSVAGKLPFFMYPHAEISGKQQDSLAPAEFTYKIISAKLVGTGVKL
ncbi:MAG: transglutaminase family protein [Betaproteobacteria bacterium]|nr:MAG: transglutaminase family protein [Betaproteobacteria bacterium]